jgi:anti-sigma factor RsiW
MTMNCHDATSLIAAHADGETDGARARAIDAHLAGCPACADKLAAILALRAQLHAELPRHAAPAALRARVLDSVRQHEASSRPPRPAPRERWQWLAGGALAGCAATLLAWSVGTAVIAWRAHEDVALEAVGLHVHATQGDRIIQVASSDQHTVKPWLSARLDYSPPVVDLQQEGFPLLGGRIDHLDHRPVATLVYGYRKHTIDVFVRPESAGSLPIALRTVRGFHVAHARGGGMEWLAVSDASAPVLTSFVQRLATEAAAP